MDAAVKKHLPFIIGITLLGIVTTYFAFTVLHDSAAGMSANEFALALFIIPCVVMLICSFAIALTANQISRQFYLAMLVIGLVTGIASMVVASLWLSDPEITTALLANSPEGTEITPVLRSPVTILRDIAAWVVIPTVGCIFGAWLGSRIHPMSGEKRKKSTKKK